VTGQIEVKIMCLIKGRRRESSGRKENDVGGRRWR